MSEEIVHLDEPFGSLWAGRDPFVAGDVFIPKVRAFDNICKGVEDTRHLGLAERPAAARYAGVVVV